MKQLFDDLHWLYFSWKRRRYERRRDRWMEILAEIAYQDQILSLKKVNWKRDGF